MVRVFGIRSSCIPDESLTSFLVVDVCIELTYLLTCFYKKDAMTELWSDAL